MTADTADLWIGKARQQTWDRVRCKGDIRVGEHDKVGVAGLDQRIHAKGFAVAQRRGDHGDVAFIFAQDLSRAIRRRIDIDQQLEARCQTAHADHVFGLRADHFLLVVGADAKGYACARAVARIRNRIGIRHRRHRRDWPGTQASERHQAERVRGERMQANRSQDAGAEEQLHTEQDTTSFKVLWS